MNNYFNDFMNQYGMTIIYTLLTAIGSYIGICIKNAYTKYINTKTKKEVCETVVNAVEQIYKDIDGDRKLAIAIENVRTLLEEKGIEVSELEVRMMIEATVNGFNQGIKDEKEVEANG